jgi:hypothetical protein
VFSGSYRPQDVCFLLKPIDLAPIANLEEKECLIQTGQRHYSEMISPESLPDTRYISLFHNAVDANGERMAHDCLQLASFIAADIAGEVALVSLARAGTPVGVIVKHLLEQVFDRTCTHYSVSIIRDRGIDFEALDFIRRRHIDQTIVFVDGWTGKGVISRELKQSIAAYNLSRGATVSPALYVLSDLCGFAHRSATGEDYLIPSAILNATISGLISRSILNDQIGPGDFHGCLYYEDLLENDFSVWFVKKMVNLALSVCPPKLPANADDCSLKRTKSMDISRQYLAFAMLRYQISDINFIKPGIGEATRVLLRRIPKRLIIRDISLPDVSHLLRLAEEKHVFVEVDRTLPYKAVSLIRSALDG